MAYGTIYRRSESFRGISDGSPLPEVTWVLAQKVRSGNVTPNYFIRRMKGEKLPINDYDCTAHEADVEPGQAIMRRLVGSRWVEYEYMPYPPQSGYSVNAVSHDTQALQQAVRECQNRIAKGHANLTLMYAERRKVYSLVADTARRLANIRKTLVEYATNRRNHEAIVRRLEQLMSRDGRKVKLHDIKHFNRKYRRFSWYRREWDAGRLSGNLASDWLALQYGWKPLISDVQGAAERFAQKMLDAERDPNKPQIMSFRGKAGRERESMEGVQNRLYVRRTFEARCTMTFRVNVAYLRTAQQTGLQPITLWELLPWSFVVDWFVDVGDYLQRLGATSGLTFVEGYYSQKAQAVWNGSWPFAAYKFLKPQKTNGTTYRVTRTRFTTPPATVKPQMEQDPLNLVRSLNAIALMRKQLPSNREEYDISRRVRKLR